jgi:hypothetical protein
MFVHVRDRKTLLVKPGLDVIRTRNSRSTLIKGKRNVKINQTSYGAEAYGVQWVSDETGDPVCEGDSVVVPVNGRKTLLAINRNLDSFSLPLSLGLLSARTSSSRISAEDWMTPRGVRTSCETVETKWLRNWLSSFSLASVRSNRVSACLRWVMSMPKPRTCGSRLISMIMVVIEHVVGQVRLSLLRDETDLEHPNGYAGMFTVPDFQALFPKGACGSQG